MHSHRTNTGQQNISHRRRTTDMQNRKVIPPATGARVPVSMWVGSQHHPPLNSPLAALMGVLHLQEKKSPLFTLATISFHSSSSLVLSNSRCSSHVVIPFASSLAIHSHSLLTHSIPRSVLTWSYS